MKETEHNREWQIPLKEIKFKYEILSGLYLPIKKLNWQIHFNPGIFFKLKKENPDIVILDGYDTPTIWLALLFAKLNKKKIISWIGSSLAYSKNTKGIIGLLKKIFIKSSNAFIAYGKLAKEYLEFFGAESDKIFVGCNVGDVNFFREKVYSFRKTKKFLKERKKYPPVLFLFVGRLVREKGVLEMLNALKDIEEKNWGLIIVGDGPLFSEIKNFCQANNLDQKIQLVGFKQKDELIRYYALADIFLFPSLREPYGIVLSEALASGLFALASKYAGATPDLLREKENGFVIDPKDINDLKTKIEFVIKRFSENPWQREDISDSVQKFTPEYYGQKIIKAIISTL
jgi:glycosyltransferase involved in cell wall biosynthesis